MWYLIERYCWDYSNNVWYYHLADSKMVRSDIPLGNHYEDGSLFEATLIENYEVERRKTRKRGDG